MKILMVLLGVILLIVFLNRHKQPDFSKGIMVALSLVIMALQVYVLLRPSGPPLPPSLTATDQFQRAAGYELGKYLAQQYTGPGRVILLQGDPERRTSIFQISGLREAFEDTELSATAIALESGAFGDVAIDDMWLPVDILLQVIQQHPDALAIVSCAGIPYDPALRLPRNGPSIHVLNASDPANLYEMMQRGLLQASVSYKYDIDWTAVPQPDMAKKAVFDLRYVFVTPENVRQLL